MPFPGGAIDPTYTLTDYVIVLDLENPVRWLPGSARLPEALYHPCAVVTDPNDTYFLLVIGGSKPKDNYVSKKMWKHNG